MPTDPLTSPNGRRIIVTAAPIAIAAAALTVLLAGVIGSSDADASSHAAAATSATSQSAVPGGSGGQTDPRLTQAATQDAIKAATKGSSGFTNLQRNAIERIVRDYLVNNPEILMEVQVALEHKIRGAKQKRMRVALTKNSRELFHTAGTPFVGNPKGDVTVVEFFDYNCGFCRRAIPDVVKFIEGDKNIKFIFKEFPIFGRESKEASRVAIAADKQGKYWALHRALLEAPGRANKAQALRIAKKLGLDITRLKRDMALPEVEKRIVDVQKLAQRLGINGTPHFFIGDKVIRGAPENLREDLAGKVREVRKNGCSIC